MAVGSCVPRGLVRGWSYGVLACWLYSQAWYWRTPAWGRVVSWADKWYCRMLAAQLHSM